MSELPPVSSDQWSKFGSGFARFQEDGPGLHGAVTLVKSANSILSFSAATGIIDVGCGPGTTFDPLLQNYGSQIPPTARIIAADLSPGMIEQVQKRKQKEVSSGNETWDRVETSVSDVTSLSEFSDGSFSHVLSGFTIFLLPDSLKGMTEALRILQHGGVFAFSSMARSSWGELFRFFKEVRPEKKIPALTEPWISEEGIKGELKAAGFRDIEISSAPLYMPFEDHSEIVDHLMNTMPFVPFLTKDMTDEDISRARELMIENLKKEYPTLPGKMPGLAIIGAGRK